MAGVLLLFICFVFVFTQLSWSGNPRASQTSHRWHYRFLGPVDLTIFLTTVSIITRHLSLTWRHSFYPLEKDKLLSDRWGSWPWARAVIECSSQGVDRKATEGPPRSAYNELSKHLNRHGGCEQMFWWRACENLLFTAPLWPGLWNLRKFPVPAGISVIYWLQYNGDCRN